MTQVVAFVVQGAWGVEESIEVRQGFLPVEQVGKKGPLPEKVEAKHHIETDEEIAPPYPTVELVTQVEDWQKRS